VTAGLRPRRLTPPLQQYQNHHPRRPVSFSPDLSESRIQIPAKQALHHPTIVRRIMTIMINKGLSQSTPCIYYSTFCVTVRSCYSLPRFQICYISWTWTLPSRWPIFRSHSSRICSDSLLVIKKGQMFTVPATWFIY